MSDFKQRMIDWKEYKDAHKCDFYFNGIAMDVPEAKHASWFLLQSVERRKRREAQEERKRRECLDSLKKMVQEYDAKYLEKG